MNSSSGVFQYTEKRYNIRITLGAIHLPVVSHIEPQ